MSNNLICFGDVVKLATKSSFVDGDAAASDADTFLGFLEQKKELLLVVPPVKEDLKDKFLEAEFIIAAVRGDKPPQNGTPLNYKQPFVLKTSDGSGYSLNNKTPGMSEAVSLRECNVKGEMYLEVHKEGFSNDTHVHDGDMNVELNIADSNRIRKTYNNKPLTHVAKAKSDTPGGVVSCSSKGRVLSFKLVKVADKTETRKFVKEPVFRRASQMLLDPVKADETSEASVLESPSRAGSIVTTGPLVQEDALASAPSSPKAATPETETPVVAATLEAPVAETVAAPVETVIAEAPVVETTNTVTTGVSPVELAAQLQTIAVADVQVATVVEEPEAPETAAPIMAEETFTGLATIELSGASVDMDAMEGSAPVHDKLNLSTPRQISGGAMVSSPSSLSVVPESGEGPLMLPAHEEQVDTSCVGGKCSIM